MKVYNEKFKHFVTLSCQFNITIDMWTSDTQNKGYCCLTCHYIDDKWDLMKRIIGFKVLDGSHDAATLSLVVMGILVGWKIDNKLCSITIDNASTNDVMVRELRLSFNGRGYTLH